jgi:hypothetical protein
MQVKYIKEYLSGIEVTPLYFVVCTMHPLSLAFSRVVYFYYLQKYVRSAKILPFTKIPRILQKSPVSIDFLTDYFVLDEYVVLMMRNMFLVSCFMSAVGLFTQLSIFVTAVLIFYLLGIPQLYGKVNHYHHLIYITLYLSTTDSAQVLSVDSLLFPATQYKDVYLQIFLIRLFIAMIYFFPGTWKLRRCGLKWISKSNIKNHMYFKWIELDPSKVCISHFT